MSNNKFSEMSNETLLQTKQKTKALTLTFSVVLIILFIAIIALTFKKGFSALIAMPIALLPLLFVSLNRWKELKQEIKARNIG